MDDVLDAVVRQGVADGELSAEANRKLVRQFINTFFIEGRVDKLRNFIDGENYIEHHPGFSDGESGLQKGYVDMEARGDTIEEIPGRAVWKNPNGKF